MKIIILEDNNEKYMALARVLKSSGVQEHVWCSNLQEGLDLILAAEASGEPFDLVITDMHYPPEPGVPSDIRSGQKLAAALKEREVKAKVVLCSSVRYEIPEVDACLWYVKTGDWEWELRKLLT